MLPKESFEILNPKALTPSLKSGTLSTFLNLKGCEATDFDLMNMMVLLPFDHLCKGRWITFFVRFERWWGLRQYLSFTNYANPLWLSFCPTNLGGFF